MRLCQMSCALHAVGSSGRDSRPESKACVLSGGSIDGGKRIVNDGTHHPRFSSCGAVQSVRGPDEDRRHGAPTDPRPVFNRNVESLQAIAMPLNSRRNSILSRWKALMHIRNISSLRVTPSTWCTTRYSENLATKRMLSAGNRLGEDPWSSINPSSRDLQFYLIPDTVRSPVRLKAGVQVRTARKSIRVATPLRRVHLYRLRLSPGNRQGWAWTRYVDEIDFKMI